MAIVVTSVAKICVVIMGTKVNSVPVVDMVTRTNRKCFGLHVFTNLFVLSNLS